MGKNPQSDKYIKKTKHTQRFKKKERDSRIIPQKPKHLVSSTITLMTE